MLTAEAHLAHLWQAHAHNPAQQALVCAVYCIQHAPHLAEWLKAKIHAELPDTLFKELLFGLGPTDGRLQALNLLAQCAPVELPPELDSELPAIPHSASRAVEPVDRYQVLFGIPLQVVADVKERSLRSDPELGRLAVALHLAHQYRLWIIARALDRGAGGSGFVQKQDLIKQLAFYRIKYTDRRLRRLIMEGQGIFWRQDRKRRDRLYLVSWQQVALHLIQQAEAQGIPIGFNKPGARQQLVDVSGGLETWQARLYAAWIAYRAGEAGLSIARATQAALFGRSEKTIRQWENQHLSGVVTKRFDYEQHPDDCCTQDELYERQHQIPDHATVYTAVTGQGVVKRRHWQRPNTYFSKIRSHVHRGQARGVRTRVNCAISADTDSGPWRSNYTVEAHLKRVKSRKFRLGEDGDVNQLVHVLLGERTGRGIWELVMPDPGSPYPRTRR